MLEKKKMDLLYEIATLDPQTFDGQVRMDPDLLIQEEKIKQEPTIAKQTGFFGYLKSFWIA